MGFFTAPRFAMGPGALEQLSALEAQRPVVVLADRLTGVPRARRIAEELAKRDVSVGEIEVPDGPPTPAAAEALAERLRERAPDWIVVAGGGRTLDLARAAWVRWERPDLDLTGISPITELRLRSKARFVAIPSTSGSGAESSGTLHLLGDGGAPIRPCSRELVPDWALLDPGFPLTLPGPARADAAAIALGHALESIVSSWTQPFSEALARGALATLARVVPRAARHPEDEELGGTVHGAAALAGLAAANAQDGAAAALAGAIAPALGLSYGRCLGIVLPYVLEFNYPSARDAYQSLGPLLGEGAIVHRTDLSMRIRSVLAAAGIPRTFAEAGVAGARLAGAHAGLAARAEAGGTALANPRIPSAEEWGKLLDAAYRGGSVAF
ncbi:MAG TPA: iron-containing alcohol dehydrogenase [Thermoplasmata archaeon]|nr:iron-containing alcohol dehydrogenase [Thermoplasmata archaeon]